MELFWKKISALLSCHGRETIHTKKNNYDKITSDRKTGNKKYISNKTVNNKRKEEKTLSKVSNNEMEPTIKIPKERCLQGEL